MLAFVHLPLLPTFREYLKLFNRVWHPSRCAGNHWRLNPAVWETTAATVSAMDCAEIGRSVLCPYET